MSIPVLAAPERLHVAGIADMTELAVAEAGVAATFQGWPAFSPDGRFVVGR